MEDNFTMEIELTLKEYYEIMQTMCDKLEENPDDDVAVAAFVDAAYHLAKANCGHLFPEDLLATDETAVNAAKTPEESVTVTAVYEG